MKNIILDGRLIAKERLFVLKSSITKLPAPPSLSILQIGSDPASSQYVGIKQRRGEEVGIKVDVYKFECADFEEIRTLIKSLQQNQSKVMIQLPIPDIPNPQEYLDQITPEYDVDGLCTINLDSIIVGTAKFIPAVALAVTDILEYYAIPEKIQSVAILGAGKYVGKPIYDYLRFKYPKLQQTMQLFDENSTNIEETIKNADLVVSCIGKPHIYDASMLKNGAYLIDVGTSEGSNGKIVGDFKITTIDTQIAGYTPVPGGVGPLTVANLLFNTLK